MSRTSPKTTGAAVRAVGVGHAGRAVEQVAAAGCTGRECLDPRSNLGGQDGVLDVGAQELRGRVREPVSQFCESVATGSWIAELVLELKSSGVPRQASGSPPPPGRRFARCRRTAARPRHPVGRRLR